MASSNNVTINSSNCKYDHGCPDGVGILMHKDGRVCKVTYEKGTSVGCENVASRILQPCEKLYKSKVNYRLLILSRADGQIRVLTDGRYVVKDRKIYTGLENQEKLMSGGALLGYEGPDTDRRKRGDIARLQQDCELLVVDNELYLPIECDLQIL